MGTFVRAVITGFGFSLGKTLFEQLKNRFMPDKSEPQEVIVVDPGDLDGTGSDHADHADHADHTDHDR